MRMLRNMLVTLLSVGFSGNVIALSNEVSLPKWEGKVRTVLAISPEKVVLTLNDIPKVFECHIRGNPECLVFRVGDNVVVTGHVKADKYVVINDYLNSPLDSHLKSE